MTYQRLRKMVIRHTVPSEKQLLDRPNRHSAKVVFFNYYRHRGNGFTLVEIMVASLIGAFVALTALGALRAVTTSREQIDGSLTATDELRFAGTMIQQDLSNLYRDKNSKNIKLTGLEEESGEGTTAILTLLTINRAKARPDEAEGDVYEVEYFLQQKEEKSLLMRRVDPYPVEGEEKGGILYAVAENIIAFEVRFFDRESVEWVNEWSEENQELPLLVEVNLAAKPPGQKNIVKNTFQVNFTRWPGDNQATNKTNKANETNTNKNQSTQDENKGLTPK